MKNIFCIMGHTASGKDTVTNAMSNLDLGDYDVRKIIPITTRPMRDNEINGQDYLFYDEPYFIEELKNLVAVRKYKVWNNEIWSYAFDKRMFFGEDNVIMSTDLTGFEEIKHTFPNCNVVGIYLEVPVSILINRLEERKTPESEIIRRLAHDIKKYEEYREKHQSINDIYPIRNINLTTTVNHVYKIIKSEVDKMKTKVFDTNKLYLFEMDLYEKDMIKKIRKTKNKEDKKRLIAVFEEAKRGFAKELMERKYTFILFNKAYGLYTFGDVNQVILPEWCREVTPEEYRKELDLAKGDDN